MLVETVFTSHPSKTVRRYICYI